MNYTFTSIFAEEFGNYMDFIHSANRTTDHVKSVLTRLDRFLVCKNVCEKQLTQKLIYQWISSQQVKSITKKTILRRLRGFLKYLIALGYKGIELPDVPLSDSSGYVPHIFSDDELSRIVCVADNYTIRYLNARINIIMPILIRLLYCCGIRLGEALLLRWCDICLNSGLIRILKAKNVKQRQIPITPSMSELLRLFRESDFFDSEKDYLFSNKQGIPYSQTLIRHHFAKILTLADIPNVKTHKFERGVCLHCFRHTFVMQSFLKSESEGRTFEENIPYLSAYLGHEGVMETDKYLRANYLMYTDEHEKISNYTDSVFPEVSC